MLYLRATSTIFITAEISNIKWSIGHSITRLVFPIHYFMANLLPRQRMLKTVTLANISYHLTSSKNYYSKVLLSYGLPSFDMCLPTQWIHLPGFIKVGLVILTVYQVPYQISKGFVVLASHLQYNNIIIQNKPTQDELWVGFSFLFQCRFLYKNQIPLD